jgi:hypothetical protein
MDQNSDSDASSSLVGLHRKKRAKEEKWEKESIKSKGSNTNSVISRSTNGRFTGKYNVGDKAADGSIIKEVLEE